jgi:hypothetical protein
MGHARKERVLLVGTRSADHIRASGHSGCIAMRVRPSSDNRPDTWLHPKVSLSCQIPLATRASSIHGSSQLTSHPEPHSNMSSRDLVDLARFTKLPNTIRCHMVVFQAPNADMSLEGLILRSDLGSTPLDDNQRSASL